MRRPRPRAGRARGRDRRRRSQSPSGRALPAFRGSVSAVVSRRSPVDDGRLVAARVPRGARRAPARARSLPGDSTAARTPAGSSSTATSRPRCVAVLRRLYAARFPIRRMVPVDAYGGSRLPLDRGGQHVGLQLPVRRRHDAMVGARVRPRDRPEPDREPLRHGRRHDLASGEPSASSGARRTVPAWRSRAARSSARSTPSAGDGAAAGRATATTSTSRRAAAERERSGRPGSNRRHSAWKADALPTELHPHGSSVAP